MRDELTDLGAPSPRLWVRLAHDSNADPELRWLIAGSAQTHRGHFHVCSVVGDLHRSVNLSDVIEVSPDSALWLDGFLHGQQATLWEFLGEDAELFDAADDTDEQRLRDWNRRFRQQGYGPRLMVLPKRDPRLIELGTPTPWCYVGDLYRVWAGTGWAPASSQPTSKDRTGWFWPGSLCEEIGQHEAGGVDGLDYCERCHRVES